MSEAVAQPPARGAAASRGGLARLGLVAPAAAVLLVSVGWPLYSIVLRSFNEKGRAALGEAFFLGNYAAIVQDDLLRQVALHSVMLAVVSTIVTVALAFPSAYIISRLSKTFASLLMILILTPFWVSIIVRLFAFTTILGQQGIINSTTEALGLGTYPLLYNTFATVVGMVAYLLPYLILILLSAMMSIDTALLTAARTMGASERRVFLDVYFPQVRPALLGGAALVFVLGLGFFLTPAILGGPHNLTIPIFIQQQIQTYQWGKAAAMGIVLLVVSIAGYAIALRLGGRGMLAPMRGGTRGVSRQDPLRATPVTVLCSLILMLVIVLLVLPLIIVMPTSVTETTQIRFPPVGFTGRWFEEVVASSLWRDAFLKSVRIGLATAVLATLCGLALARVTTRSISPTLVGAVQVVAIAPLVVPVILLGIGIFDVQTRIGLIGTDIGLILAHTALCLPLTFLVLSTALNGVDVAVEQAAWTMGAGRARAFRSVVVPAIMPAVVGSLVISFVTSWDEAVLAMFQTGFRKTLPVTIYSFLRSGITPAVSAVATIVTLPVLLGALVFAARAVASRRKLKFG